MKGWRMNQNDMDSYFWRTGQRWSGNGTAPKTRTAGGKLAKGPMLLLFAACAVTVLYLAR